MGAVNRKTCIRPIKYDALGCDGRSVGKIERIVGNYTHNENNGNDPLRIAMFSV